MISTTINPKYVWIQGNKPRFMWHLFDKNSQVEKLSFPTKRHSLCSRFFGDLKEAVDRTPERSHICLRCDTIWKIHIQEQNPQAPPVQLRSEIRGDKVVKSEKPIDQLMAPFGKLVNRIIAEEVDRRTKEIREEYEQKLHEKFSVPGTIPLLKAMEKDKFMSNRWPQIRLVLERAKSVKSKKSKSS